MGEGNKWTQQYYIGARKLKSQNTLIKIATPDCVCACVCVCVCTHTDGAVGERNAVVDVPRVAEVQLLRRWGCGWKPPLHRHPGGETFRHRRQRGHPHRHLHEELRALPQACQRVSRQTLNENNTYTPLKSRLKDSHAQSRGEGGWQSLNWRRYRRWHRHFAGRHLFVPRLS